MASAIGRSIDTVVRDGLAPVLTAAGFRRRTRTFHRAIGDAIHVANVQGSKWNAGTDGQFTLNLGVYFPATAALQEWPATVSDAPSHGECLIRERIGVLMPGRQDHWWDVDARTDLVALGREIAEVWERYAAPWFDTIPDLAAAGRRLEANGSYYLAAVAALAMGERDLAAARLNRSLARFPDGSLARRWGAKHGLLGDVASRPPAEDV